VNTDDVKEINKITGFLVERLTTADYYLNLPPLNVAVSVTNRLVQQNVLWPRIVHTEDEEIEEYREYSTLLQHLVSRFQRDVLLPMFNYIILRRPPDSVLTHEGKAWSDISHSEEKKNGPTQNSYNTLVNELSKKIKSWLQSTRNNNKKVITDIHSMDTTSDEQQIALQYILAVVSGTLKQKNHIPGNVKIGTMLKSKILYSPVEKFLLEHFRETQKPNQNIPSTVLRTALDAFRLVFKDAAETKLVNFLIQELPKPVIQQTIIILQAEAKEAKLNKPVMMTEAFLTALKKKYDAIEAATARIPVPVAPAVAAEIKNDPTRRRDTRPANIVDIDEDDDEAAYAKELAETQAAVERDKGKEEKKSSSSSSNSSNSKKRKPEEEKKKADDDNQMDEREDEEKHTKPSKAKKQKRVHFELDEE
jgi:hypothetical protein